MLLDIAYPEAGREREEEINQDDNKSRRKQVLFAGLCSLDFDFRLIHGLTEDSGMNCTQV